ncbi:hypothetical protein L6V77_02030 [Myxococcota bacterium]|nr:hypothetical protein [Myxococcota bacterium]
MRTPMKASRRFHWLAGLCFAAACGAPPPAPSVPTTPPPVEAPWQWSFASDVERIHELFVAGRDVWGVSQLGLVHWDRQSGAVRLEGPTAPGAEVTAIASGPDGTVYAGLPAGIAWRASDGTWSKTSAGPLSGGVTALAPRAAGGVWVGLASGLAWFEGGLLHVVNDRHRVRAFSVAPDGAVWAATDGFGLVRMGDVLQEFTSGQGLCGNQIRAVFAGPGGRVGVTCLETRARNRFTLGAGGRFTTYEVPDLPNPIERVEPLADRVLLRTVGADFLLEVESPLPPTPGAARAVASGSPPLQGRPIADAGMPEPPPPEPTPATSPAGPPSAAAAVASAPPASGAPPSAGVADELARLATGQVPPPAPNVALPAPVSMPAPIAPAPPPLVDARPLAVQRAAPGPVDPALWRLRPYPSGVPTDAEVSATLTTADGTTWYALAHRGVVAVQDAQRRRFTTQTLVPAAENATLIADHRGTVLITDGLRRLLRWREGTWTPWVVDADPAVAVLGAAFDELGQAWAAGWRPGEPTLRLYKSMDGGAFAVIGRIELPDLGGSPRLGQMAVDREGRVVFSLFRLDGAGKLRAVGLARVPPSMDRVEIWREQAFGDEVPPGEIRLPDAWVNTLALAPAGGTLFLGTNAGLTRVSGSALRTFDENDFLASEVILSTALAPDGRLWAGTMEGLGYVAADEWHPVRGAGLGDRILALAADRERLWVGTDGGLYVGQDTRFARVDQANGGFEVTGPVRDIEIDADGTLWVLTGQGVLRARPTGGR